MGRETSARFSSTGHAEDGHSRPHPIHGPSLPLFQFDLPAPHLLMSVPQILTVIQDTTPGLSIPSIIQAVKCHPTIILPQ